MSEGQQSMSSAQSEAQGLENSKTQSEIAKNMADVTLKVATAKEKINSDN